MIVANTKFHKINLVHIYKIQRSAPVIFIQDNIQICSRHHSHGYISYTLLMLILSRLAFLNIVIPYLMQSSHP